MLNIERNQSAPDCLKQQIDYKCGDVLQKLEKVFLGKCYICETDLFSTNIEHFVAHKGNKALKFDWNNLFLACSHCNNIKLTTNILDPTNPKHDVEEQIIYKSISFSAQPVEIEANIGFENDALTKKTVEVLNKVYNGHTEIKTRDAKKLKEFLIEEMLYFQQLMLDYSREKSNKFKVAEIEKSIKSELHKASKLTAFKRQIIKDYTAYSHLKKYFD